jgi:uncharacterized membrane protein
MAVLGVLVGAILIFRGLGVLGIDLFDSWSDSTRYGLSLMLLFTGVAHFTPMKEEFSKMIPKLIPYPLFFVAFTGVLEIAGAIGLLIPTLTQWAAIGLITMLILMLPANINAAVKDIEFRGHPPIPLWVRIPMQVLFITLLWLSSIS